MSSDMAVKKANHREQMEILDRQQSHQVQRSKDEHKQEMSRLRSHHTRQKQDLQSTQKTNLEQLKQTNDTFVRQEKINHKARLDKQNLQAQKDYQKAAIERQRENARTKQQAEIEKENHIIARDQHRNLTMKKKQETENTLENMDKAARERYQRQRGVYKEREMSLQEGHNKNLAQIDQTGQQRVHDRKHKYQQIERQQTEAHQAKAEDDKQNFIELQKRQHNHYHKQLESDEKYFENQIKDQRKQYAELYQENERMNKASLDNQRNRYEEELFHTKRELIDTVKFYEDRKQDPFYTLVDFDADFEEGEAFYEVTARVPEHEMDNVRVHVQPDKITLQAARAHNQEFTSKNEKIGSNINQTIRQEFSLNQPADHEKVVKSFDDGILKVIVPKKGFVPFGMV